MSLLVGHQAKLTTRFGNMCNNQEWQPNGECLSKCCPNHKSKSCIDSPPLNSHDMERGQLRFVTSNQSKPSCLIDRQNGSSSRRKDPSSHC